MNTTDTPSTAEQLKAAIAAHFALLTEFGATIATATRTSPLGGIPAGHLYVKVMARMPMEKFESYIRVLIDAGVVVRDQSHLLRWVGEKV